jgi:hypothetical protein
MNDPTMHRYSCPMPGCDWGGEIRHLHEPSPLQDDLLLVHHSIAEHLTDDHGAQPPGAD